MERGNQTARDAVKCAEHVSAYEALLLLRLVFLVSNILRECCL